MYRRKPTGWTKHLDFIILDMVSLFIAYTVAYYMKNQTWNIFSQSTYRTMVILLVMLSMVVALASESFRGVLKRGYYSELKATVKQVITVILLATFYLFLVKNGTIYSRQIMIVTGCLYLLFGYSSRVLWRYMLLSKSKYDRIATSVLIVTTEALVERVLDGIKNNNYEGNRIVGISVVDKNMSGQDIAGIPVVADYDTVLDYVCREWVDEVFINIPSTDILSEELFNRFTEMGVTVHLRMMHSLHKVDRRQNIERLGKYTVLTSSVGVVRLRDVMIKRCMDIASGIVGCIVTGLLMVVVGPLIYMKSPGPIFFAQTRVGKNGRKFKIYKFRSMYMDAEERKKELMSQNKMSDGMMFKVDWDTRIIGSEKGPDKGVGNFIRKWSLDEWPQFYNVLKGDMSLIGTRPPTLDEWEKYERHHRARLATKPGLTGMWQVSGRSKITDFEEVVRLDTKYIAEWTLGLDIKILLKTVVVVLRSDGAQ